MRLKHFTFALLALPLFAQATPTTADNQIAFDVEVEKEVSHDLLQATLFIQAENKDLALANKEVNRKINQAFSILKGYSDVELRDDSRSTQVRYNKDGKQDGWIARGRLVLQSKNVEALSKVISKLNGILAIEYVNSQVSSTAINQLEEEMMQQALAQVERKAQLIQQSLHAKGYKIVELIIRTPAESGRFVARPYAVMAKMASPEMSDQMQLGTGKANVRASINAKIQLIQE
ncbi:SIMPL domain-containing protein [Avibacterium paragallinarum]|uniref:SIMPL domain-containing protein n=1 Tax=Avibacterium paragallinarum TaxID=728 RepID=A0AAE5TG95_AVIPA|nr:SIMPL domain-containing protein [Avibacterium paragallinarum]MEE3609590.1 SIMPL domain-containing protein [Avibacterium paragallinarum]MEE3621560.1 SIMPL domain-containing protein [Avibacterium paragallinarum]MEE3669266.1 SIMPL domain-containing protein [Avibacterium paragallinarum]MEE3681712.1 SIMPL domain-containing protein [Avibacterium paragallinarum]MEE4386954.1 SIMPL domain-containing protein [Avibacterium paragallinarum]